MTHDTGFAPNPFYGFLTLANCKPRIRETKKIGDWIAGFTSKELNGDPVGEERLVYLMKVTNIISYEKYWNDPIYNEKKPILSSNETKKRKFGDNIYRPLKINSELPQDFEQIQNVSHDNTDKIHDLGGKKILISNCFYYFGYKSVHIPLEIRPAIPKYSHPQGFRTHDVERCFKFISFIENNFNVCIVNDPSGWPRRK